MIKKTVHVIESQNINMFREEVQAYLDQVPDGAIIGVEYQCVAIGNKTNRSALIITGVEYE
jgi:hypothetical protein